MTEVHTPADITVLIRDIRDDELAPLLDLYTHLIPNDAPLPPEDQLLAVWHSLLNDPNRRYFVAEVEGRIVSTCNLSIIANLTRGARPYGLIENVVTHADYRGRGIATRVLRHTLDAAWARNCYKVMLLTSAKEESTLHFYEQAGFKRGVKTGFIALHPGN
jgi:GNAT superfamily N-acetyltransferase